jgi:CheY-like chemotaxis protein
MPGKGTVVTLWLPAAAADAAPAAAPVNTPGRNAGSARVLIVDDDILVRETLAAQLEDRGFVALAAADGVAALALLDGGAEVDALVTDLSMPHMDGVSLIREVRNRRPGLPAIVLTGTPAPEGDDTDLQAREPSFLLVHKPIRAAHLAERLAHVLANRDCNAATHAEQVL